MTNGDGIVISTTLRAAIGTFGGSLKDTPATQLSATVGGEVFSRSGVSSEQVNQVIVGNVLQACRRLRGHPGLNLSEMGISCDAFTVKEGLERSYRVE